MTQSAIVHRLQDVLHSPQNHIGLFVGIAAAFLGWFYLFPFFVTNGYLRDIPAPSHAAFSNWWLFRVVRAGNRSEVVDELHRKYGPVVRIAPNHVSIASDQALKAVYGHGNGFLKSDFYDAFVSIRRGLFNTRDRNEHTRKRKMV
jgi:benzoate 4-monooxygenase